MGKKLYYGSDIAKMAKSEKTEEVEHLGKTLQYGSDIEPIEKKEKEPVTHFIHHATIEHPYKEDGRENWRVMKRKKYAKESAGTDKTKDLIDKHVDPKHAKKLKVEHTGKGDWNHESYKHQVKVSGPKSSVDHAFKKIDEGIGKRNTANKLERDPNHPEEKEKRRKQKENNKKAIPHQEGFSHHLGARWFHSEQLDKGRDQGNKADFKKMADHAIKKDHHDKMVNKHAGAADDLNSPTTVGSLKTPKKEPTLNHPSDKHLKD